MYGVERLNGPVDGGTGGTGQMWMLGELFCVVLVGVGASLFLDGEKIAAVMGLLGASLTALIQMLNGIAGTAPKQEKPEFEVIKDLITRLDKLDRAEPPMQVDVEGSKVTVKKGADIVTAKGNHV